MKYSGMRTLVFLWLVLAAAMPGNGGPVDSATVRSESIMKLAAWLEQRDLTDTALGVISDQQFATAPLSKAEAEEAARLLWNARMQFLKKDRAGEMESREIRIGDRTMPFWYKTFGDAPKTGRSLFISMHGGGGAPAAVNDQQYENQKRLYQPAEGVYLVPRAPTNTWNLWHEAHIDQFFDRLIANLIVFENVNPDRIYFMGYSAGGDGVYQLAPRMADRLAAAAMMAGHPNEARPEGLRNIAFTIHMGANDAAYNRNRMAEEWGRKLKDLREADPEGYIHETKLHEGKGHWMNLQDAAAVPWMSGFTRNAWPRKVVWIQDDVVHSRFYWLQVDNAKPSAGDEVRAAVEGNTVWIEKSSASQLELLLHDRLIDPDRPIRVIRPDGGEETLHVIRTIKAIANSLRHRDDPVSISTARAVVQLSDSQ